jgi:hypothetical protein
VENKCGNDNGTSEGSIGDEQIIHALRAVTFERFFIDSYSNSQAVASGSVFIEEVLWPVTNIDVRSNRTYDRDLLTFMDRGWGSPARTGICMRKRA